jgi:hypothetical protein
VIRRTFLAWGLESAFTEMSCRSGRFLTSEAPRHQ